jgi:hypothetical protein
MPFLDRCICRAYTSDVDELLGAILGAIVEFLLEAFLELIAAAVLDLASSAFLTLFRGVAETVKHKQPSSPRQTIGCSLRLFRWGGSLIPSRE